MNIQQKAIIKRTLIARGVNVSGLSDTQLIESYQSGEASQPPVAKITPDLSNTGLPPVEIPPTLRQQARISAQPQPQPQPQPQAQAQAQAQPQANNAPSDLLSLTLTMLQSQGYTFTITATSPTGQTNTIQVS